MRKLIKAMRAIALPGWVGLNILVASLAIFSGYASTIDQEYMPFAGVMAMTFPLWYMLSAALLVINLIFCRWLSLVPLATLLIALKPFLVFSPFNFSAPEITDAEKGRSFKILSYNVLSFVDAEELSTVDHNRTMHTILHSDADAVALLESESQGPMNEFVPQAQIDSLNTIYPYFSRGSRGTVLYSKRPILHVVPPNNTPSKGSIEIFRTSVNESRPINIIAVHLESFGLNNDDKELYRGLTDAEKLEESNKKETLNKVRRQLISKLLQAFKHRAWQGKMLRTFIEQLPGDVIVCGDFNDVPGCRTVKILEEIDLKDAYAATASGPTITYNAPYFKFRIDHVLWRGDFRAVNIERGDVASSDHYPMLTTFVWDE